jgi:hypothetical protein
MKKQLRHRLEGPPTRSFLLLNLKPYFDQRLDFKLDVGESTTSEICRRLGVDYENPFLLNGILDNVFIDTGSRLVRMARHALQNRKHDYAPYLVFRDMVVKQEDKIYPLHKNRRFNKRRTLAFYFSDISGLAVLDFLKPQSQEQK